MHQQKPVKGGVREQSWPSTLMGLGLFVAVVSFFTVASWTLIRPSTLLRVLLVLCFIGNLMPYARSGFRLGMERLEWFLFNLLAAGPLLTSLLLWLNFLGHGPATYSDHRVDHVEGGRTRYVYFFVDGHLDELVLARSRYRDRHDQVGHTIRISQADGLLGVPVIVRWEAVLSGQ
ncbi:MAG: hypothetical protein KIT10_13115 [Flavobacteriales bacterium]|nr:hypothetical protein [Flavobacteriales bacterium]